MSSVWPLPSRISIHATTTCTIIIVRCSPQVQYVVAADENLSQVASGGAVNKLLCVGQLQAVHDRRYNMRYMWLCIIARHTSRHMGTITRRE